MPVLLRLFAPAAALVCALAPAAPALARPVCGVDMAALNQAFSTWRERYDVQSDIDCDAPQIPAHQLMCESAWAPDNTLWFMGLLDDAAWVYGYENATGTEVNRDDPPRDADFIARRDACSDIDCLCAVLIEHTNGSLGGLSPYPQ